MKPRDPQKKKNFFLNFFSQFIGGEILLSPKVNKWLLYIALLITLGIVYVANQKSIERKENEIKKISQENSEYMLKQNNKIEEPKNKRIKDELDKIGLSFNNHITFINIEAEESYE